MFRDWLRTVTVVLFLAACGDGSSGGMPGRTDSGGAVSPDAEPTTFDAGPASDGGGSTDLGVISDAGAACGRWDEASWDEVVWCL